MVSKEINPTENKIMEKNYTLKLTATEGGYILGSLMVAVQQLQSLGGEERLKKVDELTTLVLKGVVAEAANQHLAADVEIDVTYTSSELGNIIASLEFTVEKLFKIGGTSQLEQIEELMPLIMKIAAVVAKKKESTE